MRLSFCLLIISTCKNDQNVPGPNYLMNCSNRQSGQPVAKWRFAIIIPGPCTSWIGCWKSTVQWNVHSFLEGQEAYWGLSPKLPSQVLCVAMPGESLWEALLDNNDDRFAYTCSEEATLMAVHR